MLLLVTVCRPAKAFIFDSGHPDVCTAIIESQIRVYREPLTAGGHVASLSRHV